MQIPWVTVENGPYLLMPLKRFRCVNSQGDDGWHGTRWLTAEATDQGKPPRR